jgi:hypothetical protein
MHLRMALEVAQQEQGMELVTALEQEASMQQGVGQHWHSDGRKQPRLAPHIAFEAVPSQKGGP